MGFEAKVPPIPTREQEIVALNRLEESWLKQPYYKYYMNEDLRREKMKIADRQNKVRSEFWLNVFVFSFCSIPIAMILRRFSSRNGMFPRKYNLTEYTFKERSSFETVYNHYRNFGIRIAILVTFFAAFRATNWEPIEDQNCSHIKVEPII